MHQVYKQCSHQVYHLMVRMVGRQDAEDLTQQTFLQAYRNLGQFKGQAKLDTWIYRIATNEALQYLRRRGRQTTQSLNNEPPDRNQDCVEQAENSRLLETALAGLEPELRAVLMLKEQSALSYNEIADTLGIPEGTVGSRLNRARKRLREELAKIGWD